MNESEKLRLIKSTLATVDIFNHASRTARKTTGFDCDSELGRATGNMCEKLIEATEYAVGDLGEFVSWFIYEAPKTRPIVWIDNTEYAVTTPEELLIVINEFRRSIG